MMTMLVCEDSPDDFHFVEVAIAEAKLAVALQWVRDGEEAVQYLLGQGPFGDRKRYPIPGVLVVDLKMPRMGGLELIEWLQQNPDLQVVPTIVMSSSSIPDDVTRAYRLGANTYFLKPMELEALVHLFKQIGSYWELAIKPSQLQE